MIFIGRTVRPDIHWALPLSSHCTRPWRYCWAQALELILCDLLGLRSVHSLGDTTESFLWNQLSSPVILRLGGNWSWNRCVCVWEGGWGGSILFLPFQIPVFSIATWHPPLSPCWQEPSFSPLFKHTFLLPPLTTFSCLGRTHMLCVFACDQSVSSGWVGISCSSSLMGITGFSPSCYEYH